MWRSECGFFVIFCTSFQSVMGVMCFMYVCIVYDMLSVKCNVLCICVSCGVCCAYHV